MSLGATGSPAMGSGIAATPEMHHHKTHYSSDSSGTSECSQSLKYVTMYQLLQSYDLQLLQSCDLQLHSSY